MSKKKAFSGSTMTLKDFHGGSIPSDLPLPSAPGAFVKVPDRERQSTGSSWGGSGNRGYTAGARQGFGNVSQRGFEEKVSYIPNSANIGRNFDEDERKPLDSFPRRGGGSDEDYQEDRRYRPGDRVAPGRSDIKSESAGFGTTRQQQQNSASSQHDLGLVANQDRGANQCLFPNQVLGHFPKQSSTARSINVAPQQFVPAPAPAAVPNAWGIRRETDTSCVNENISSSSLCAESVASRFAQASAIDKVSSGRWQSKLSLGFEQQPDRFGQTQHLDTLYDGRKAGLDSGNLSYGGTETDSMGRRARSSGSVDQQHTYSERDRYAFDDYGGNGYGDRRKGLSVEVGNTDAVKDFPTESTQNIAADILPVYAETGRASFGELALSRLDGIVEYSGNTDASWKRTEVCVDTSKSEMIALGKTLPRQMSPVMDLTEGKNGSSYPKEKVLQADNIFEVSGPYYNTRSAQSLGNSRDSLISDGAKSTLSSDYKVSGNVVQNLDNEASRNRFRSEDARVPSPLRGNRSLSTESNLASATGSLVHVRSDSSARPRLNLLPRTKPLEPTSETVALEHMEVLNSHSGLMNKSFEYHSPSSPLPVEGTSEAGNVTHPAVKTLGTSDIEEEIRRSERPKLNLKPRTIPVEQLDANLEKERKSLFGGARPRELVLKERGVDDVVIHSLDPVPAITTGKGNKMNSKDTDQLDEKVEQSGDSSGGGRNIRQDDKVENIMFDRKVNNGPPERLDTSRSEWRDLDKKDHRADMDKQDLQRNIRRNENWRNPHNNYKQERRQDPDKQDSWRKLADPPSLNGGLQKSLSSSLLDSSTNVPGKHGPGRATSAVELAEAFSRSASLIVNGQRFSSQGSSLTNPSPNDSSGRKALPFSRLTDSSVPREVYSSSTQRHINGY